MTSLLNVEAGFSYLPFFLQRAVYSLITRSHSFCISPWGIWHSCPWRQNIPPARSVLWSPQPFPSKCTVSSCAEGKEPTGTSLNVHLRANDEPDCREWKATRSLTFPVGLLLGHYCRYTSSYPGWKTVLKETTQTHLQHPTDPGVDQLYLSHLSNLLLQALEDEDALLSRGVMFFAILTTRAFFSCKWTAFCLVLSTMAIKHR